MKTILFILFIAIIPFFSDAQVRNRREFKLNVGFETGLPLGTLATGHSIGFGGSAEGDYSISDVTDITIYGGYISFAGKSTNISTGPGQTVVLKQSAYSVIPVLAGFKFHFKEVFWGQPQLGMSFFKGGSSAPTFAVGFGYLVSKKIDLSAKYQIATKNGSSISFTGFRIAYIF